MKRLLLILPLILSSCDFSTSQSQRNAKQYVNERLASLLIDKEDVESIEVGNPDTVISSVILSFMRRDVIDAELSYTKEEITHDSLNSVIEQYENTLEDILNTAKYGLTEEIKQSYSSEFRYSYPVIITMKSGVTKKLSVMMENDGITPYLFLHEFIKKLELEYPR